MKNIIIFIVYVISLQKIEQEKFMLTSSYRVFGEDFDGPDGPILAQDQPLSLQGSTPTSPDATALNGLDASSGIKLSRN